MAFNLTLPTQPPATGADYKGVFAALGALWQAALPPYGVLAGNCHAFAPPQLAPNWDAGPVLFNYPTIGEWVTIQGLGSPAEWAELPTHLSDLQFHTMGISTAVLTGPPPATPALAAYEAGQWIDPLVGFLTMNTDLDGAVASIIPLRYLIGTVEFAQKEYFGLVLQSVVQRRRWYPRG